MCSDKASREIQQYSSNGAAQTLLMPKVEENLSWYCRMCQRAARSNGSLEGTAKHRLGNMLRLMRDIVYRDMDLIRDACVYEDIIQQRIGQLDTGTTQNAAEWSEALLADAVQHQTTTLNQLRNNTKKARQLGDEAAHILEEYAHVD